jgi:hypothetical protein
MEIFNNSSSCQGYEEYSPRVYDDMLRAGRRLSCIATDDNHNTHDKAYDPFPESFGGFTMIHASALEYRAVADALAKGQCYASSAPLIKELYYEDGRICIETSPARTIDFTTDRRHSKRVYTRDGSLVTKGEFELDERDSWVRVTVTDTEGRHANTRAYFRDELEEDA